jgi:serine/threonine protein phosphatase PrpC
VIHAVRIRGARGAGQDRALVVGTRIVLADGAGGTARGAHAAERAVAMLTVGDDFDAVDRELMALGGQATAVAITVDGETLRGASVGDSEAWLVDGDAVHVLTRYQRRKPLLGDGGIAVTFTAPLDGTLVVGSDGLFKYGARELIVAACGRATVDETADALMAAVELPGGALQDDVSLIVCRTHERR